MNAIPLAAPDGTVYTWACGVCHHVRAGAERMLRNKIRDVRELAEAHRDMAESCCQCRRCNKVIGAKHFGSLHCARCQPLIAAEIAQIQVERAKQDAIDAAVSEQALKTACDALAALSLRDLMSSISEDYYCAGWMSGLERDLWRMLQGGDRRYGMGEVTAEELGQLRALHERCGGWWYYSEEHGELFIPTAEWIKRIA